MRTLLLAAALFVCGARDAEAADGPKAAIQVSVGASWTDKALSAWHVVDNTSVTPSAIVEISCVATHGSQSLYLLLRASSSEATSAAIEIKAGNALTLDGLVGVSTVSFQGSGGSTTGACVATVR